MMHPSLSAFLPVYNAQQVLGQLAAHLLEALPDLTPQFELAIIDDGSTDATFEIAHELALCYPQVQHIRSSRRLGLGQSIRLAMRTTSGELSLLCAGDCRLDARDLHKLWQRMGADDVVFAISAARRSQSGLLGAAKASMDHLPCDLMLLRRSLMAGWLASGSRRDLLGYLLEKGYPLHEVPMRDRQMKGLPVMPMKTPAAIVKKTPLKRPNYLDRLKALALGE